MSVSNKYCNNFFIEDFDSYEKKEYAAHYDLVAETVPGGYILPFIPSEPNSVKGYGGVLRSDLSYVERSALTIEAIMEKGYAIEKTPETFMDESVVYLGYFLPQWGHFLVDFLPRLWYLLEHDAEQKLVYVSSGAELSGNYLKVLQLFGIDRNRLYRQDSIQQYREIIVPDLSMSRPYYYTESYREIIYRIVSNVGERTCFDKIYWTRTKFSKAQETEIGEKDIEQFFKQNGYTIISPEKCSVEDQIYYWSRCKNHACLSGSIPHNIVWAGYMLQSEEQSSNLVIVNKTHRINLIQILLNDFSHVNATFIDCNYSLFPVSPGSGPFWVGINDNLRKYAHDHSMTIPRKKLMEKVITRKRYIRYSLMYARMVRNPQLDLDGRIEGSSRPFKENKTIQNTYFMYRVQLGDFPTYFSCVDLLRRAVKKVYRKLKP